MPEDVFTDWGAYLFPTNKDHFQHYYRGVPPLPISLGQLPHRTTNPISFRHAIPFRTTTIIRAPTISASTDYQLQIVP